MVSRRSCLGASCGTSGSLADRIMSEGREDRAGIHGDARDDWSGVTPTATAEVHHVVVDWAWLQPRML